MQREIMKKKWYSFPLLINPQISKYSGAYTGRFIAITRAVENTRMRRKKENLNTHVS